MKTAKNRFIPCYRTDHFSWSKKDNMSIGVSELSTLSVAPGFRPDVRLFSDSADLGFYVMSHCTSVKKLFLLQSEDANVMSYVNADDDGKKITLRIYNT